MVLFAKRHFFYEEFMEKLPWTLRPFLLLLYPLWKIVELFWLLISGLVPSLAFFAILAIGPVLCFVVWVRLFGVAS